MSVGYRYEIRKKFEELYPEVCEMTIEQYNAILINYLLDKMEAEHEENNNSIR